MRVPGGRGWISRGHAVTVTQAHERNTMTVIIPDPPTEPEIPVEVVIDQAHELGKLEGIVETQAEIIEDLQEEIAEVLEVAEHAVDVAEDAADTPPIVVVEQEQEEEIEPVVVEVPEEEETEEEIEPQGSKHWYTASKDELFGS